MALRGSRANALGVVGVLVLAALVWLVPAEAAAQNARVSGTVVDATTNTPLAGGRVNLCPTAQTCVQVTTSATGSYSVLVPAGTYDIFTTTFESQGFLNAWHDGQMCPGACGRNRRPRGATAVTITISGRFQNFALARAGRIAGRVTDAATGAPVVSVDVVAQADRGLASLSATTDQNGQFDLAGLPPGAYGAVAFSPFGLYPGETFGGLTCFGPCNVGAAPRIISVSAGASSTADFRLTPGATISGRVTAAGSQLPVAGATVDFVHDSGGRGVRLFRTTTDAQGRYTAQGLPGGRYRLLASSRSYVAQVFGGVMCTTFEMCIISNLGGLGVPVDVVAGGAVTERNFELTPGGGFTGTVVEAGSGQVVTSGSVTVYQIVNGAVVSIDTAPVDGQGRYVTAGLPPGQYLATFRSQSHPPVTHRGHVCGGPLCTAAELLADPPIQVGSTIVAGQDFQVTRGGTIRAAVTDAGGAPLGNVSVFVVAHAPTPAYHSARITDASGVATFPLLPPGNYAIVAGGAGLVSRMAGGPICQSQPICTAEEAVAGGQVIGVASNGISPASLALPAASGPPFIPIGPVVGQDPGIVYIDMPTPYGPAPTSYVLEAATAPGAPAISLPMPLTGLRVPGVPRGTYYLRVRALNAAGSSAPSPWVRLDVTNQAEPPTDVSTWMNGSRLMVSWSPTSDAPGTTYVLEAGSASGRADIAQLPVTGGHFTYAPVPPGVYFMRLRAVDSRGLGEASPETMLVVGAAPAPPRPMGELRVRTEGRTVSFSWEPPAGGAEDYVLEAGTDAGLTDIGIFPLGRGTSFSVAGVPPGIYAVRLRARNARGLGLPSPPQYFEIK